MYTYMHLHIHIYIYVGPRIRPNTVAGQKKKTNAQCKKKALRTTETNPLHCITIIKSFA